MLRRGNLTPPLKSMELFYRKTGSGRPAIILHGLFGMSDNWMTIARRIARKHTVYIPDQRNHGQSPWSDDFSYDLLADDLAGFIRKHGLEQVRLIGHSMGGKVAMNYALRHGDEIDKLVVVDIAPRAYTSTHFKSYFDALMRIDLNSMNARTDVDQALAKSISNPAIRQFLLKNLQRNDDNTFSWKVNLRAIYQNLDQMFVAVDGQASYKGETLFVSGGKSGYIRYTDHTLIRELFPLSEIVTIPQASHWIHSDAPEEFCNHLRRFFSS
jgi:pimeloyl-ACP methyl ester carboxylesterase